MLHTKVVAARMLVHFRLKQFMSVEQFTMLTVAYSLDWVLVWIRSRDTLTTNLEIDKSIFVTYWSTTININTTIYLPMYEGTEAIEL